MFELFGVGEVNTELAITDDFENYIRKAYGNSAFTELVLGSRSIVIRDGRKAYKLKILCTAPDGNNTLLSGVPMHIVMGMLKAHRDRQEGEHEYYNSIPMWMLL